MLEFYLRLGSAWNIEAQYGEQRMSTLTGSGTRQHAAGFEASGIKIKFWSMTHEWPIKKKLAYSLLQISVYINIRNVILCKRLLKKQGLTHKNKNKNNLQFHCHIFDQLQLIYVDGAWKHVCSLSNQILQIIRDVNVRFIRPYLHRCSGRLRGTCVCFCCTSSSILLSFFLCVINQSASIRIVCCTLWSCLLTLRWPTSSAPAMHPLSPRQEPLNL